MSIIPGMDIIDNEVKKSVQNIENFIDLISIEQAIKELSKLANDLLLFCRSYNHEARLFGSKKLDQCAINIGALALELIPNKKYAESFDSSLFLYLATSIYAVGGHTRVMLDFVKAQPKRRHVLVLTDILGEHEAGQKPAEWFKELGVEIIWLKDRLWLAKLLALQSLLIERRPSAVFLFNHHQDAVSVASCQPGLAKRFIYYHHCDHYFALGVYVPHFSHVDLSPRVFHTCQTQLGINNSYLPLATQDHANSFLRKKNFKKKEFKKNSLRTASAGTWNKYVSSEHEDYFYTISSRLADLPGTHLHIGYLNTTQIEHFQALIKEKKVDWSRIIFLSWVESIWDALCEWNVDIYIPSFPQGGGKTAIEVMGAGIPVAVRDTGNLDELNGIEMYYPEAYLWNNVDDLLKILHNLDGKKLVDAGKNARFWYEKFYSFDQLEKSLDGLPDVLPNIIDVPGSADHCHTCVFLSIDETEPTEIITSKSQYSSYTDWFNHCRWTEAAAVRLATETAKSAAPIEVHLLTIDASGSNALIDTFDSLNAQLLSNWRLTVFSPVGCPDAFLEMLSLAWVDVTTSDLGTAMNSVTTNSSADWLLLSNLGFRVEPVFTTLISATAARHSEWRFIYLDEDRVDANGEFSEPILKPDTNIDLLRSTCYVGYACLIHRELWKNIPNDEIKPGLLLGYAAALRCFEIFGAAAIGHIDEIIFHRPTDWADHLENFEKNGKELLQAHLWRQGIFAEVDLGLVKGSFFVDYPLLYSPSISIIIPTKDRLDLIRPCIESLLEKTRYLNYEVIVMDNCSTDPATLEYLAQLPIRDQRFRVIPYLKEYNYSAINNFAARQANGDFLLLLNNDTVILQENWLERLVSIGLRNDIGAVGCRLVYTNQRVQHAGVILGLGGVAEHIGIGLPISDTGYMGRAQLTQNFSAVTAACILVRKNLFFDAGELDEKDFAVLYNDIDLCLKISELGYRIVWTPFVTLIHHGNSSLTAEKDPDRDKQNLLSRRVFIKKWRSRLGNDPAYNRHLSLRQREWMIDGDFDVPWHPDLEPLPRIVAQPPDEMGVGQYRMIGPLKELTENERICSFLLPALNSEKRFLPYVSELARAKPTVLFLQNAFTRFHFDDLQNYAELLPDIFRVFGQDDIVFSVPQKSAARQYFGKDTKARVRRAVALCHRAIVTTEPIAEAMRGMVDDIRVVPNYLERSRWGNLQSPRNERRKLRVGWAGAQQHQGDLEFILPVVEATANEVDWVFMGMCLAKLRYHIAELHNPVSFDQYPAGLAALDLDLAIAPLEINRFNTAKSNLRLLEYGAVGYPVVCTDIEPYRDAPVTCVPNNPKAWIDAIRAHIHDLDATRAAGGQLRDWVLSNWMLDQHLDEWMKALLPD
ncbi:MAG: glycosyltransferase [Candidatus Competibacteraceae bacterium]